MYVRNSCNRLLRRPRDATRAFPGRRLVIEPLEERRLLQVAPFRLLWPDGNAEDMRALLREHPITGATIITHGFQPGNTADWGDSLLPLARAIRNRADAATPLVENDAWLLDYDVGSEGGEGHFDAVQSILPPRDDRSGHVVLLFDWAPESQENSAGWAEAAGDSLFSLLVGLGLVEPDASTSVPLHFIGHSFGAAVTSEAVERLARFGVVVDQVTYLDPHDFDQDLLPIDGSQKLYTLGQPQLVPLGDDTRFNYGVTVWSNVEFCDAYYQTRGRASDMVPGFVVPEGRPIPGAYNVPLQDGNQLPESYSLFSQESDHSWVWNGYYLATVTGSLSEDVNGNGRLDPSEDLNGDNLITVAPSPAGSVDWGSTGYAYSRVAGGEKLREQARGNFFSDGQDHEHSSPAWFTNLA